VVTGLEQCGVVAGLVKCIVVTGLVECIVVTGLVECIVVTGLVECSEVGVCGAVLVGDDYKGARELLLVGVTDIVLLHRLKTSSISISV
jgi:hypothetical protein